MSKSKLGRTPIYGRAPMTKKITVRLSVEQASALSAWCAKHGCSAIALMRESVLESADLSRLGVGMAKVKSGKAGKGRGLSGEATSIGVQFTDQQEKALRVYAARKKLGDISSFIRESALARVGAGGLGTLSKSAALLTAVRG